MHERRPSPFVLASTSIGTMILNHLDEHQTPRGSYGVGYQLLQTGSFDSDELNTCIELLRLRRRYFGDGVLALDCGANIGVHAVKWAIEMNSWGGVMAFEAQERIYYALAGNIALNNCFNASAVHAALGNPKNKESFLDIPVCDYTKRSSFGSLELKQTSNSEFIGQNIDCNRTQRVPLVKIDSFDLSRIDLMKIDVEGMEMEVLKGALNQLKKHKPILQIEIIKSDRKGIQTLLLDLGYELFDVGINILAIHREDPSLSHIQINSLPPPLRIGCKRCLNAAVLCDFREVCDIVPLSMVRGVTVDYYRCLSCDFIFTTASISFC